MLQRGVRARNDELTTIHPILPRVPAASVRLPHYYMSHMHTTPNSTHSTPCTCFHLCSPPHDRALLSALLYIPLFVPHAHCLFTPRVPVYMLFAVIPCRGSARRPRKEQVNDVVHAAAVVAVRSVRVVALEASPLACAALSHSPDM